MSAPKTANAWVEEVWFVECPDCEDVVTLGAGVVWDEGCEQECDTCEATFILGPQAKDGAR